VLAQQVYFSLQQWSVLQWKVSIIWYKILYSICSIQYTIFSIIFNTKYTIYSIYYTIYSIYYIIYSIYYTIFNILYLMYIILYLIYYIPCAVKQKPFFYNILMPPQILRGPRGNICDNMMFNITQCPLKYSGKHELTICVKLCFPWKTRVTAQC
jgi:hypothetical protein